MALIKNDKNRSITYLEIIDGSICERVRTDPNDDAWEKFVSKNTQTGEEKTSWIVRYSGVEGLIEDIKWVSRQLTGTTKKINSWNIYLDLGNGTSACLSLPANSSSADRFTKLADNINFSEPVLIKTWKDTKDGKSKVAFMVSQNEANVPQMWNASNLPEPRLSASGEKDYFEREDFLFKNMNESVIPRMRAERGIVESEEQDAPKAVEGSEEPIPF